MSDNILTKSTDLGIGNVTVGNLVEMMRGTPPPTWEQTCLDLDKKLADSRQHVTQLENRLRALWDKLEGERKFYDQRISHLESWINSLDEVLRYNGKDGQREWCGSEVGYLYPGQRVYVGGDKP
jgi:hypothetical protein